MKYYHIVHEYNLCISFDYNLSISLGLWDKSTKCAHLSVQSHKSTKLQTLLVIVHMLQLLRIVFAGIYSSEWNTAKSQMNFAM